MIYNLNLWVISYSNLIVNFLVIVSNRMYHKGSPLSYYLFRSHASLIYVDYPQIQHAYEILSDPYRRRDYDNFHLDELKVG